MNGGRAGGCFDDYGPHSDEPDTHSQSFYAGVPGVACPSGYESPVERAWSSVKNRIIGSRVGRSLSRLSHRGMYSGIVSEAPAADEMVRYSVPEGGRGVTPVGFMDLPVFEPPQGVYLVYGRPGCGKTVFSAACVDRLMSENPGVFQHIFIFVPGDRPEWDAIKTKYGNVTMIKKVTAAALSRIVRAQKDRYHTGKENKIMIILDDQMGQGQGIHDGPLGDLIDRIAASNRQPELNIVFFVLAQHVSFIPPSMRLTARMVAYSQPTEDSLSAILGTQGIECNKEEIKSYAQANQFVVFDCWSDGIFVTKSYHFK